MIIMILFILAILIVWLFYRRLIKNDNLFDKPLFVDKDRECDHFIGYPNGWYIIESSLELSKNEVKAFRLCGQDLILFRGNSGTAHVLDAYCPHMGANMGILGTVVDEDCIRCPFHGWTFSGTDGSCTAIPNHTVNEVNKLNARINVWIVIEVNQSIMIWYHSDAKDPDFYPQVMKRNEDLILTIYNTPHATFEEVFSNPFDLEHFNYVHRTVIKNVLEFKYDFNFDINPNDDNIKYKVYWNLNICFFGHKLISVPVITSIIGPSIVESTLPWINLRNVASFYPISPYKTMVKLYYYRENNVFTRYISKALARIFKMIIRNAFDSDTPVWNNMISPRKPILTKNDKIIKEFRLWFKRYYTSPSL